MIDVVAHIDGVGFSGEYAQLVQRVGQYAAQLALADGGGSSKRRKALARARAADLRSTVSVTQVRIDGEIQPPTAREVVFKELRRVFTSAYRRTKGSDDDDLIVILESLERLGGL